MSGLPRIPRDIDPRRPKKGRENETSSERKRDDIEEWEDLTEEPVREGADEPSSGSGSAANKKKRQLREFEELAGEPVLDEEEDDPS